MTSSNPFYVRDSGVLLCEDCAPAEASEVIESETDCPSHCDACGALLSESLTSAGVEYVEDALRSTITQALFTRADGSAIYAGTASVHDAWRSEYRYDLNDKLVAAYDLVRERQGSELAVMLVSVDGIARQYGVDEAGQSWTQSAREDGDYDDCAICGAAVSEGWLCLDGGDVVCSAHVVTPAKARDIATRWHDGQGSSLYALSSSGLALELVAYDANRALANLETIIAHDGTRRPSTLTAAERHEARTELRALAAWSTAVRSRGYADAVQAIQAVYAADASSWQGGHDTSDSYKVARIAEILRDRGIALP